MGSAHLFLGSLFVLGEGLGGVESGRVESRLAVSTVLANFRGSRESDPRQRLVEALEHAGEVLYSRSQAAPAFAQAWASCAAVLIRRGRMYAARVGDIRLYTISEGEIRPIFSQKPVDADRPVFLGMAPTTRVEVLADEVHLRTGDRLLLANPVLFSVPREEWARTARTLVPTVAARRLVEAVSRSGDNRPVSVQVVQVGEAEEQLDTLPEQSAAPRVPTPPPAGRTPPDRTTGPVPDAAGHQRRPPSHPAATPAMDLVQRRGRRAWIAVAVVAVAALGGWWASRGNANRGAEEPWAGLTPDPTPTTRRAPGADAPPVAFWERVAARLEAGGAVRPADLRAWSGTEEALARHLRQAQEVLAAAQPGPTTADSAEAPPARSDTPDPGLVGPPYEPEKAVGVPPGNGGESPQPPTDSPPSSVAPDPAGAAPTDAPPAWDPKRLPRNFRVFEAIFSLADHSVAGRRLRDFIHARHARVERLFKVLDAYLAMAPRTRSLSVLRAALEAKPGPRTRAWLRGAITRSERVAETPLPDRKGATHRATTPP